MHWVKYIVKKFDKTHKKNTKSFVDLVENHSYFTQQLANVVWMNTTKTTTKTILGQSIVQLLSQYDMLFQKELDGLTNHQANFLKPS